MQASNIPVLLYTYRYFKLKVFFKGVLNVPNFPQNNYIITTSAEREIKDSRRSGMYQS